MPHRVLHPIYGSAMERRTCAQVQEQTEAVQRAIDDMAQAGGGHVRLEAGLYVTTTIFLRSRVRLEFCAGAVLKAWGRIDDFPRVSHGNHHPKQEYHLLYAEDAEDFTICGSGVIDGNCYAFWDPSPREILRRGESLENADLGSWREDDSPFWIGHAKRLMPMVELRNCRRFRVDDITLKESAGWTLHATLCDDVWISRLTIDNPLYGPNTDGIDISGCRNVFITGCKITCGDDAIIVKALEHTRSSEHICVSDCIIRTHCAALGIGAETFHPIREISFSNCVVPKALRILQIELWEAGLVENVTVTNISGATMTDIPLERPLYIDVQHHGRSDGALGVVRNIVISGLTCVTRGRNLFTAADGATIEHLTLRDLHFTVPEIEDPESSVPTSHSNQMSNDNPETRSKRALFVFDNCRFVTLENIHVAWPGNDAVAEALRSSSDDGASYPGDGRFDDDKRKREAVRRDVPMHAIWRRRTTDFVVNAPFLTDYLVSDSNGAEC